MSTRGYVEKDYYAALGVPKDAAAAEIKKAYRVLARKHHPDANKGDPGSEEKFKTVSEAYDVLSDKDKRAEYDEARALFASGAFRPGGGGGGRGFGGGTLRMDDLFGQASRSAAAGGGAGPGGLGDLFGGIFGGAGRAGARGPRRGADVESQVTLDFADAVRGVTVPLRMATPHVCTTCGGSGARPGTAPRVCPVCGGSGSVTRNQGGFGFAEPCRECRGQGQIVDDPCPTCRGSGETTSERTLTVRIPAGVADGQRIRLKGRGMPGERGGPGGDLFVVVHVSAHPLFGRRGEHLTLTLPVTFPEAALGAEVAVPTLDGAVTLRVPAGTASGRTFRVRGRGVPLAKGGGDLLVTVEVAVPQKLSAAARSALEAFAAEATDDPRASVTAVAHA